MTEAVVDIQRLTGYALLLMGFVLLFVNHISVVAGDPWLIPEFLKLQ
ncbi:MAG: hypothetical protein KME56_07565 [Candidatus Thiodiazotropha sp. (ex Ctena orbiculata)]|uniref:Uncharacterized protein n=1 Tax=Candidatus Thiodiazotropha taylori TaxID=2792791 RepID=A0A944M8S3_9GAMM|nr:hypothetical protein [Candidatus Thiodiazotropha taylori]MBT2988882.1 hypothetical protein [Candidatus Thiodiazotropha taylori]MBT2996472.1 hypothetical protein [Candidatus Thiodiazotropha taylori]MBT3000094.1 hypothetical protein [Candidatus Thiodiazotropha taylori]MBT3028308.1 hypothetical protein [Candidatus Thiodiazotropha taylori]